MEIMPIFLVLLISSIFVFSQFSEVFGDHSYLERPIEHSSITIETLLVDYLGYGVHIKKVQADYSEKKLVFDVYITDTPAFVEIVLPRDLLDSKDHAEDDDYKIIYDGNRAGYDEVEPSQSHRTLNISLRGVTASELIELEIFGTQIFDKYSQKKPKISEEEEVEKVKVEEIEIEEEPKIKEVNLEQEVIEIEIEEEPEIKEVNLEQEVIEIEIEEEHEIKEVNLEQEVIEIEIEEEPEIKEVNLEQEVIEIEIEEEPEIKEVNLEQEVIEIEIEEEVTQTMPITPTKLVFATTPVTSTIPVTKSDPIPFTSPDEKSNKNSLLWSDKSIYIDGSIVHIKGKIKDVSSQSILFVKVYSPSNYIIASERVTVSDNGEFEIEFNTSDYLWYENGEHLIQTEDLNGHINQIKIKVIEQSGEFYAAAQEIPLDSEIETSQENNEDTCFICKNEKLNEKLEKQGKQIDELSDQYTYPREILAGIQGFFGSIFSYNGFF